MFSNSVGPLPASRTFHLDGALPFFTGRAGQHIRTMLMLDRSFSWLIFRVPKPSVRMRRHAWRPLMGAALAAVAMSSSAAAQETASTAQTREQYLAEQRGEKATVLRPEELNPLERRIDQLDRALFTPRTLSVFMGSTDRKSVV